MSSVSYQHWRQAPAVFFFLLHAAVSAPPIRDSDDDYDDVKRRDDRGLHRNRTDKLGSVLLPVSDGRLPVTASRTRSKTENP